MMNSNNSVVVECTLEKELVRKEGDWVGEVVDEKVEVELRIYLSGDEL